MKSVASTYKMGVWGDHRKSPKNGGKVPLHPQKRSPPALD